ncbi:MAG TPA: MYXO-CTERM sorting domain-containing protein [Polyangiaceae bacterium]|nr:MYXO-CTERM sorting domain-containing protein [Polyangiaceae bacterium]
MRHRDRAKTAAASLLIALSALACGGQSEPGPGDDVTRPSHTEPLQLARQLARSEPSLASALGLSRLELHGAAASSRAGATDPFVRLPATADGTIDLRGGERAAPLAQVRSLTASQAPLELVDGVAVYRAALLGADTLWLEHGNAIEQLLELREQAPSVTFSWQLCRAAFLAAVRSTPELGLVFSDGHGTDRLRIPPAFALDAAGARRELEQSYTPESGGCGRVDFTLRTQGLAWPLLIDPALEAVVWTERTDPDHKPPGRFAYGMAYDEARDKTVMFGGSADGPPPFLHDTWEWDGDAWHDVTPSSGPEGRLMLDLAYSSLHGGALLVGGLTDQTYDSAQNDVWVWNGSWTKLEPSGDALPTVAGHGIAFDSARKVLVLYGGYGADENRETWELDAKSWSNRGAFAISPGSLDFFSMTYDAAQKYSLVFGGATPAGHTDDTFVPVSRGIYFWNGKGWTSVTATRPSARYGMASAFDDKRGRIVLFGGFASGDFSDETWEYTGGSFERRTLLRSPSARYGARLAYDKTRDRMVLFGGANNSDGDDTWTYAHFGSTCQSESDCDGGACVDGVCCQDKRCGTCEACSELTGTCQPLVSADDENGDCAGDHTCDAAGACLPSLGQGCSKDANCASGHCTDGVCCDEACDGACRACAQPGHEGTCSLVKGDAAHGSCPGQGVCGSSCDGKSVDCTPLPIGLDCGTSCADAVLTTKTCDDQGACHSSEPNECPDHLLCDDDVSCLTSCNDASDCASGFECLDGACREQTTRCADDTTVEGPGGREDCGAYRCVAGECRTSCERAADCATDRVCDERGQCISPEAAVDTTPSSEGCGCRSAGAGANGAGWLWVLVALGFKRRRSA